MNGMVRVFLQTIKLHFFIFLYISSISNIIPHLPLWSQQTMRYAPHALHSNKRPSMTTDNFHTFNFLALSAHDTYSVTSSLNHSQKNRQTYTWKAAVR